MLVPDGRDERRSRTYPQCVKTSVIIAVRNDPTGLQSTLEALKRQTVPQRSVEVVVVDDGSTDETCAVARRMPGIVLVERAVSGGAYAARNGGVRRSTGEYLAITDAGCLPEPDWIANGTARLREDPFTVVAGRIAMPLGGRATLAAIVDVVHHLDQYAYVHDQQVAVTANILTSRLIFEQAGPFDENLTSGGDREWVARARSRGATLVYAHDAVVVHAPRHRAAEVLSKSVRVARGASVARAQSRSAGHETQAPYGSVVAMLKPWNRTRGLERVLENGARPSRARWLAVGIAQVALVQLPQALAGAYWDLRLWRSKR